MTDAPADLAPDAPYLRGLNAPQRDAVLTTEGPVLVLAGAGTGKTAALTARLAHLLFTRKAWPSEILSVTFTNKAAREMRERVGRLVGQAVEGMPWLGTFHAIGAKMLRRHAELVGLESNFTILDTDDQLRLLKQLIQVNNLDEKRWTPRALAALIDRWKNRGWTPKDVDIGESEGFAHGKGAALYQQYQDRLRTLNACDFGDLLLHMLVILKTHRDVLELYQQRFRYIMVDEYQDTNSVQYLWLRLLAQERKNICCVGDDDQSIYSWRGAQVENILKFEQDFPGARIIRLEQNYRSTPHILGAASGVIANNAGRLGKTLWTEEPQGDKVQVVGVWDGPEEARRVGEELEAMQRRGESIANAAILVRAQFQTREFEDRFISIGMPYRIVGGARFYERMEIRDAMAYLRVIAQPADDLAFERIVNTPKRGLGDKAVANIHRYARAQGIPLFQAAAEIVGTDELSGAARKSLANLVSDFARWRGILNSSLSQSDGEGDHLLQADGGGVTPDAADALRGGGISHAELARLMLDESGYTAMLQADRSAESAGRLENLAELARAMEEYETLGAFLEHVALVMDNDATADEDKVTMMTVHAAKGLEFDTVFLAGWEEGVFPSQRALDEGGNAALEEERRLAYVAITRARRRCIILHAANRRIYGQWTSSIPSRFVAELPAEHTDQETTLTGGESLWRANWSEHADPFANVGRSGTRGPGWQRAAQGYSPSPLAGEGGARSPQASGRVKASESGYQAFSDRVSASTEAFRAAQARSRGATTTTLPVESRSSAVSLGNPGRTDLEMGQRVFHQKFGYGTIAEIEGNKLEIDFEQAGRKRVLDSFVSSG